MNKNNFIWLSLLLITSLVHAEVATTAKKNKMTLQDLLSTTGKTPQTPTPVVGVRGLDEISGEVDTKARDFAAIERMEHVVIHEDELAKFIEEGKLR